MIDLMQTAHHAERIVQALAPAYPAERQGVAHLITDALSDLRHLADQHQLRFADLDREAHLQYRAEVQS